MNYRTSLLRLAFIFALGVWFVVAVGRTFFNFFTMPSEYMDNSIYKKQKVFTESSTYVQMKNFSSSGVILDTDDGSFYFLARYLLYPKRIYRLDENRHPKDLPVVEF